VWLSQDAIAGWCAACRRTPGGQRRFSNLAIETTLMLGAVLRLPLRQTEGYVRSLIEVMELDLAVPDHTTLARRRRTVDAQHRRCWPRRGPVDMVIDSTGLKFFGAEAIQNGLRPAILSRVGQGQAWRNAPFLAQAASLGQSRRQRDHRPRTDR
jgi:hypothetical protein